MFLVNLHKQDSFVKFWRSFITCKCRFSWSYLVTLEKEEPYCIPCRTSMLIAIIMWHNDPSLFLLVNQVMHFFLIMNKLLNGDLRSLIHLRLYGFHTIELLRHIQWCPSKRAFQWEKRDLICSIFYYKYFYHGDSFKLPMLKKARSQNSWKFDNHISWACMSQLQNMTNWFENLL